MKTINYILAIIFTLFAYVQLNDPDGYIWAMIYMVVAIVSLFAALGKYHIGALKIFIAAAVVCLLWLTPALYDAVVNYDANKITDPTVTHTADVQTEAMKEFFGLLLGVFTLIFHYKKSE